MEDLMNRYMLLALLPLAACSGTARSEGTPSSGAGGNRTFAVNGFTSVDAAGPDDVDVRVGSGFSVRAEGDPKVLDKLEIVREGDTLKVRRKNHSGFSWGNNSDHGAKIFITMPRMTAASTTGSGDMSVDHVDGDKFQASATGSGDLNIGSLSVQAVDLSVTGSGSLATAGTARTGSFSVTGSGDITAPKLSLGQASINVMGPGGVTAAVNGAANVSVMGPGDVTLTGGAKCTTSKMGPGNVSCS
jgi:hypothetical protein